MRKVLARVVAAACLVTALAAGAVPANAGGPPAPQRATAALADFSGFLVNMNSWRGAAVLNASTANYAAVIQYSPSAAAPNNDYFTFQQLNRAGEFYYIKPWHSSKCLVVLSASTADYAHVVQYSCSDNGVDNDVWERISIYEGGLHRGDLWRNAHSGRCLTVLNASTSNNTRLVQYSCSYWQTEPHNERWVVWSSL